MVYLVSKMWLPGVTHKSQWDQFNRQMLDRKKFPASLASHVLKNKNDVFNEWLAAKGCWEDVAIKFERKVSEIKEFKKSRGGLKKRDILLKYPKEYLGTKRAEVLKLSFLLTVFDMCI